MLQGRKKEFLPWASRKSFSLWVCKGPLKGWANKWFFPKVAPFNEDWFISRINGRVKWWECERQEHVHKKAVERGPETNSKRSCIVFCVTCIAFKLRHFASKMLERSLQFLIGSCVTVVDQQIWAKSVGLFPKSTETDLPRTHELRLSAKAAFETQVFITKSW